MASVRNPRDPRDAFERLYIPEPNSGCWLWLGRAHSQTGYGEFGARESRLAAHRFALTVATGEEGFGKLACHHCDNRLCVNPNHMFWGTYADNTRDAVRKGRMFAPKRGVPDCKRGHRFSPENTSCFKEKNKGWRRVCLACARENTQRYRAKRKLEGVRKT